LELSGDRIGLPSMASPSRSMPLPLLTMRNDTPRVSMGVIPSTVPRELSPAASRAIAQLQPQPRAKRQAAIKAYVFASDLGTASDGEDYSLKLIVKGPFSSRKWEQAREQLVTYLSLPRSSKAEARARFYLGQTYFLLNQKRPALFEFLLAQNQYPVETQPWIQTIIRDLAQEDRAGSEN